jgi:hypothetical protein
MSDVIQFVIVTLTAVAALAALVVPYIRRPKTPTPGCSHCPSAKRTPAPHTGEEPRKLPFLGVRSPSRRR